MKLTLVRGIPGTGKSTLAIDLKALHLEADMFCVVDGEYKFDVSKHKFNHDICRGMTEQGLAHGCDVVVSNTFTQLWELQPYIELAKKYKANLEVLRMTKVYKTIHNIPEEVIERMTKRFEDYEGEVLSGDTEVVG